MSTEISGRGIPGYYELDQSCAADFTEAVVPESENASEESFVDLQEPPRPEWTAVRAVFLRNRQRQGEAHDCEPWTVRDTPRAVAELAIRRAGNSEAAAAVMDFIEYGGAEPSLDGLTERAARVLLQAAHTILEHYDDDPAMALRLRNLSIRRNSALGGLYTTDYGVVTREPHIPREDWMSQAACKGLGAFRFFEVMHKNNHIRARQLEDVAAAKAFCQSCPVREACLEYALDSKAVGEHGVWGGLDADEREAIKKTRQAAKPRQAKRTKRTKRVA